MVKHVEIIMAGIRRAVSGVTTHPCLRTFPEALEEEGGLPSVSVAGEALENRKEGLSYPLKCPGLQEPQEMETRQGCVRRRECRLSLRSYQSPVQEVVRELRMVALIVPATNPHKPSGQSHIPGKQVPGASQDRDCQEGPVRVRPGREI